MVKNRLKFDSVQVVVKGTTTGSPALTSMLSRASDRVLALSLINPISVGDTSSFDSKMVGAAPPEGSLVPPLGTLGFQADTL